MPLKEKTIGKLFWSIGEVATELGVSSSLIRYWEKEFGTLRPKRTGKGDRSYTRKDIDQLRRIHHLVKEQGFTLQGAREQLRTNPDEHDPKHTVREHLERIRSQLIGLRDVL